MSKIKSLRQRLAELREEREMIADTRRSPLIDNTGGSKTKYRHRSVIESTAEQIEELDSLAPFGQGFERPMFAQKDLKVSDIRVLGKNRNVLRMRLTEESGITLDGICFGEADAMWEELKNVKTLDILYSPKINEFGGRRTIQIEIREYRTA